MQLNPRLPGYLNLLEIDGDLVPTSDVDTRGTHPILQAIVQNLRLVQGEYFLDVSAGVPYLTQLLGQKEMTSDFESVMQNTILSTPGVSSLLSWSATTNTQTRTLTISFVAQTTAGEVNWAGDVALQTAGVTA